MKKIVELGSVFLICLLVFSCTKKDEVDNIPEETPDTKDSVTVKYEDLGVGYRWSPYGIGKDPGIEYYGEIGTRLAGYFGEEVKPKTIWILGTLQSGGACGLNFPASPEDPLIWTKNYDYNEKILSRFDSLGYEVWLQVEPGHADVVELINLVLERYKHHPCIYGFGVDVEWHKSVNDPEMGVEVPDSLASVWLETIQAHNPKYKLFLKHWLIEKMPETVREGIEFIDDSQYFDNLDQMVDEFVVWANHFSPSKVGFQYGYSGDQHWWKHFENPVLTIGEEIMNRTTNTNGLFWVDFTLKETYPPLQN